MVAVHLVEAVKPVGTLDIFSSLSANKLRNIAYIMDLEIM